MSPATRSPRGLAARVLSSPARLFYGWRIVGLGSLINAVAGGIYMYGFGIFFLPIQRDLGLTRAETSLVFSLSRAEGAIEAPIAGYLVDRFGPRGVLAVCATLTGIGYVVLSLTGSFLGFLLVYLLLISIPFNAGFAHSTITAVNNWFIRRRGFAMSVVSSAFSLGGAIVSPALGIIVAEFGWRTAAVLSGVVLAAVVVPAAMGLKRSPESMGLLPDGDTVPPSAVPGTSYAPSVDFTVKEGLRTREFWILAAATTLRLAVVNVVTIQFVPFMVWKGEDELSAAFLLAFMSALSIPFRIGLGWVGDRLPKTWMLAGGMLAGSASFVLLDFAQERWLLWTFVVMFAIVEGVNPLNWALIGDWYGRASFATLRGSMAIVYTWGTAAAPVLAGTIYDRTESYSLMLWAMIICYTLGALIFLTLRRPALPARLRRDPITASAREP